MKDRSSDLVIIGAGPAGLACSHSLAVKGLPHIVLEKEQDVGGLCKTIDFNGFLFDIGGHRLFSRSKIINDLWSEIMGEELLRVKRQSRIYYMNKYFNYPLSPIDTFLNLGIWTSLLCMGSYIRSQFFHPSDKDIYEDWMIHRFGKRLYEMFFETYTQKVWNLPCKELSSDWANQRIRGLSLGVALKQSILNGGKNRPKTLSHDFLYPRHGVGQFFKRLRDLNAGTAALYQQDKEVVSVRHDNQFIRSVEVVDRSRHSSPEIPVNYLFTSMPLPQFIKCMQPVPPARVLEAAENLKFRSLIVVNVIINRPDLFSDQWLYIHSPEVKLGRIQNYKNWSPAMVPDPDKTSLGLEYFCSEEDEFWRMSDIDMIDYAAEELQKIGVVSRDHLLDGFVVRMTNAYPVYTLNYREELALIQEYLDRFRNCQCIGRAGLFRYDNADRAMLTGIIAAKGFLKNERIDLWNMEWEQAYIEG